MKLKWAFNSATVMKLDWDAEFKVWEKHGWKHVEVWHDKIKACTDKGRSAKSLGKQMRDAGITPVGNAAAVVTTHSSAPDIKAEADGWAARLDQTADVGAPALTFIALGKVGTDVAGEYRYLAERLRVAGDLAKARGVRINFEFLGGLPIAGTLGAGIDLVNQTNHPAVGLLFDLVHYYVSPSHVEELATLQKGKLFHVHVDDSPRVPMEQLTNDFRVFPGEGRIDVPGLIDLVRKHTGFDGWYGMEIYDSRIWELPADEICSRQDHSIKWVEARLKG